MPVYTLCEPHPLFVIALWCLLVHGSYIPVSYVYVCTKSDHSQACIEPHPSINCCCRPQECYPCSMSASHEIAVQSTRIRPTPIFLKHVLVSVNLLEPPTALYNYAYQYLLVITGICIISCVPTIR